MKKNFTYSFILVIAFLFSAQVYSQQLDSSKKAQVKYLSKDLSLSETSAAQVVTIMDKYKQSAKIVISDKALTPEDKKARLDKLIEEKNKQLFPLLSEQQFNKIVPTSERSKKL
ncbi:hypothetical protein [Mucilaginibacter sp.]|uniref:hypothetical protein n=1 Tax=Mucilaginibacter sp. TaxID=1882438 RepID=UPI003AFFB00E